MSSTTAAQDTTPALPPCGVYRTTVAIGEIPAGRLVYFHNHGDPGPGVYLPRRWKQNRAEFHEQGVTLPVPFEISARSLEALPVEGFYRVTTAFFCCEKKCTEFASGLFVQLGYDGDGTPLLFVPVLGAHGIALPETGNTVSLEHVRTLAKLDVARPPEESPEEDDANRTPAPPARKRRTDTLH